MQAFEMIRNSDPLDVATQNALADTARTLSVHANRFRPIAIHDVDNNKICIDCDELIPPARASIPEVVRCIDCQELEERTMRFTAR